MPAVVLAADVGGSSTRAVVCDADGRVLATARADGANPNATGREASAALIRSTLDQARVAAGSPRARAVVVGLAGGSRIATDLDFLDAITPAGAPRPSIVSDLAVAFGSATPADSGCVLVAGTGAVAGRIADGRLVEQRDGWGWLLGDAGAGFWIGRELVREVLRGLERHGPRDALADAVLERAGATDRVGLVQACYEHPPIWLAGFAPMITAYAEQQVAVEVADRAADHLARLLIDLHPRADEPVVLAGSVATAPGPVATGLGRRLAEVTSVAVLSARSGTVGAAWTALRMIAVSDPAVHARLVNQLGAV